MTLKSEDHTNFTQSNIYIILHHHIKIASYGKGFKGWENATVRKGDITHSKSTRFLSIVQQIIKFSAFIISLNIKILA